MSYIVGDCIIPEWLDRAKVDKLLELVGATEVDCDCGGDCTSSDCLSRRRIPNVYGLPEIETVIDSVAVAVAAKKAAAANAASKDVNNKKAKAKAKAKKTPANHDENNDTSEDDADARGGGGGGGASHKKARPTVAATAAVRASVDNIRCILHDNASVLEGIFKESQSVVASVMFKALAAHILEFNKANLDQKTFTNFLWAESRLANGCASKLVNVEVAEGQKLTPSKTIVHISAAAEAAMRRGRAGGI
jgi:hypothetical protein